ncbi:glycoside hydrolase family 3 N-terminal domain-containing protein [Isoptericola halotolerans]|uniref:Beta-N-acetylhexosaminidase n=1 Tax=Isoptericola halotolerans TaxID=300560 RepID=A0ABX2A845_9MICO|nr:glycoside hydrolase family 3 protein [Isoptericola halotolerans]NOV98826.1 beta-N-acetylhexosaminidase [Isoptericola halotolerans]
MSAVEGPDAVRRAVHGVLLPGFTGTTPPRWLTAAARQGLAGVVLFGHNTPDVETTAQLTETLRDSAPHLLVAVDEEGGDVTRLEARTGSSVPGPAALGAVDDELLTQDVGEALGRLLAATGIDLDLAPVLDVDVPGNPVIGTRAYGDDVDRVERHGGAFVRGLHRGGAGACAKHFPGHGSTTVDSHLGLPVVTAGLAELRRRDLVPFARLVGRGDDGPDALMTAHVVVPEIGPGPASLEPGTVALARGLGFDGPVVTDALDMRAVSDGTHVGAAAVRAVQAGADLLCLGTTAGRDDEALFEEAVGALVAAVGDGRVSVAALAASAARTRATVSAIHARRRRTGASVGPQAAREALTALQAVGARAARAAVRTLGPAAAVRTAPAVVDLRRPPHQAAGDRGRHVLEALVRRWPGALVHAVATDDALTRLLGELDAHARRPVVVVTRELAAASVEEARLVALRDRRPDLVVVHTGVAVDASRWLAADPARTTVVLTHGAGRATADAAAQIVAGGTAC